MSSDRGHQHLVEDGGHQDTVHYRGLSIRFITVSTLSFFLDLVNILQLPCCGRPFSTASAAGSSRGEEALHSKSVYASLGPC